MMNKRLILIILFFFSILNLFAQDKNISIISLEKVNVVYRGILNPIRIAFPGAKSFNVEAYGNLEKLDSIGNYNWNVTSVAGIKAFIKIDAIMKDNSIIHEEREFEIKGISPMVAYINSPYEWKTYEMTYDQLKMLNLKTIIENLNFSYDKAYDKIESFDIEIKGKETILVKGEKIDAKVFSLIKDLPIGTELLFENIQVYNPKEYCLGKMNSIKIRIIEKTENNIYRPIISSNDKNSNIIYRGIDNILNIKVPNAESYIVKGPELFKMEEDSTYTINVSKVKEDSIALDFIISIQKDSVIHVREILYIKNITPKKIAINDKTGKQGILKMSLQELRNATIDIKVDDFNELWANMRIWGFNIKMPDGSILEANGDEITDDIFDKITQLHKKSLIEVTTPYYEFDGVTYDPQPLKVMILDNN